MWAVVGLELNVSRGLGRILQKVKPGRLEFPFPLQLRASDLGIAHVQQGVHDKGTAFSQLLLQTGLHAADCGFVGDDVIDLPILLQVGFAASVPNGHPEVTSRVHYVSRAAGGHGAAREICDFVLRAQGKYAAAMAPYLMLAPTVTPTPASASGAASDSGELPR